MKKLLFFLLLALVGLFHPPLQAAVGYDSRSPQTEESTASRQPRSAKKQLHKPKGIRKTQKSSAPAIAFILVFSFIGSIALIVLGIVFQIKTLLVSGIVFASILFLLLIAIIVLLVAGALAS